MWRQTLKKHLEALSLLGACRCNQNYGAGCPESRLFFLLYSDDQGGFKARTTRTWEYKQGYEDDNVYMLLLRYEGNHPKD